ncbi:MAG TPA: radical SAM protein [Candidatus Ozemobacteraceae bacterium]|mgnify:CR=1 FL=1|nr:radical SAM protein [Candidatus Ozemobacteraceae bacterium]
MSDISYRQMMRRMLKYWLELQARVSGRRFYCQALSGLSGYNIVVNSDMTVSCNCQDFDGTGHIGDLSKNSLEEVFRGPTAHAFRTMLAGGRLPILTCSRCVELKTASPEEATRRITEFDLPSQGLMIENTVLCNLNCVACARHQVMKTRHRMSMTLDDIARLSSMIRQYGIKQVAFFNLGEPFLAKDILRQLQILRHDNPALHIVISTNAALLDTDDKREAALLVDELYFSIDGVTDAMVQKYQRKGSFQRSYANLVELLRFRKARGLKKPWIEWKYVVFNWNDHPRMIRRAIDLAKASGVDGISFWPTMNPLWGTSLRFRYGDFFKTVGFASWKGREVHFT